MTHDELQDKLEDWAITMSNYRYISDALRAVVELHSPMESASISGEPIVMCSGCYEEESSHSDYPCLTIQAIEKELA